MQGMSIVETKTLERNKHNKTGTTRFNNKRIHPGVLGGRATRVVLPSWELEHDQLKGPSTKLALKCSWSMVRKKDDAGDISRVTYHHAVSMQVLALCSRVRTCVPGGTRCTVADRGTLHVCSSENPGPVEGSLRAPIISKPVVSSSKVYLSILG